MLDVLKTSVRERVPVSLLKMSTAIVAATATAVWLYWGLPLMLRYTGLSWWSLAGLGMAIGFAAFAGWEYWDDIGIAIVEVDGQIGSDSSDFGNGVDGHEIAESIETADEEGADALLVVIDSPGGDIVPSDSIRQAISEFDGPTAAFTNGLCASGGYLAACACDQIVSHESSLVGSIGVLASQLNFQEMAREHGVEYHGFTAGELKDAGHPLKKLQEKEREYIQHLIDTHYQRFIDVVTGSRGLSEETIRDLGARVFVGSEAVENGLVDDTGRREDAVDHLADRLGRDQDSLQERIYEPKSTFGLAPLKLVKNAAFGFGAGVGSRLGPHYPSRLVSLRSWFDD